MFIVYRKQLVELAQALALERFEDDMGVHLRDFAPLHTQALKDDGIRRCVRFGVERARVYGVTNPGLLRFYVELMFKFGSHFDADPLLPWAGHVLRDPSLPGEVARMDQLYEAMCRYLEVVEGPDRSLAIQALHRLRDVRLEDVCTADRFVEQQVLDALAWVHPQRCRYLGDRPLRQLIRQAREAAGRHQASTHREVVLMTGMLFTLGYGAADDPVFPWVQKALQDAARHAPDRRAARLHRLMRLCLSRLLQFLRIEARA